MSDSVSYSALTLSAHFTKKRCSKLLQRKVKAFTPSESSIHFQSPETCVKINCLKSLSGSLRLIPRIDTEGLIPAYEALTLSPTISRLLRENKSWEIPKYIASGDIYGMKTFNQCLLELIEARKISPQVALQSSDKREELEMHLRNKGLL